MRNLSWLLLFAFLCVAWINALGKNRDFAAPRRALIGELRAERRQSFAELGAGGFDPRVLDASSRVPRHEFVLEALRTAAHENRPLPIGYSHEGCPDRAPFDPSS